MKGPPPRLTDDQVRAIRQAAELRRTLTNKQLARRYGVSRHYVAAILQGTRRAGVS